MPSPGWTARWFTEPNMSNSGNKVASSADWTSTATGRRGVFRAGRDTSARAGRGSGLRRRASPAGTWEEDLEAVGLDLLLEVVERALLAGPPPGLVPSAAELLVGRRRGVGDPMFGDDGGRDRRRLTRTEVGQGDWVPTSFPSEVLPAS